MICLCNDSKGRIPAGQEPVNGLLYVLILLLPVFAGNERNLFSMPLYRFQRDHILDTLCKGDDLIGGPVAFIQFCKL